MKVEAEALRIRAYPILSRAIEEGIECGWRRAHKHTSVPTKDMICAEIDLAIWNELDQVLELGDGEDR